MRSSRRLGFPARVEQASSGNFVKLMRAIIYVDTNLITTLYCVSIVLTRVPPERLVLTISRILFYLFADQGRKDRDHK